MANHKKIIALFDVDGTLTVPRKVTTPFTDCAMGNQSFRSLETLPTQKMCAQESLLPCIERPPGLWPVLLANPPLMISDRADGRSEDARLHAGAAQGQ